MISCPCDTDGDGNCGRPACPYCSSLAGYIQAKAAADAADTLANYLQWKRPDLEESITSIRVLGEAIRRSMPESNNLKGD